MNIGRLDRRIQLDAFTETKSPSSGGITTTWTALGRVAAQITYRNGQEDFSAEQKQAVQTVVFRIRYRAAAVNTRLQVTYQGKQFDILAVAEVGRREALDLTAENRQ